MNVLLFTDGIYPFVTGGMQKHSYFLTKYLLKNNHLVTLLHCVQFNQNIPDEKTVRGLFNDDQNFSFYTVRFPKASFYPGHYILESYCFSKAIYHLTKNMFDQYDLIYIQGLTGWYFLNQNKKQPVKAKVIANFHGLEMFQMNEGFRAKMQAVMLRWVMRKIAPITPYTQSLGGKLTEILVKKLNFNRNHILEIPIGVEKKWLRQNLNFTAGSIMQFVFVGRNEPRKGFAELINCLNELSQSYSFHLHVIGPFEMKLNYATFYGLIKDENRIIEILDGCHVLLCPSHSEGMPTVILEAMARGCAIAATNVGAVSCEVDNANGWLFEPLNYQSMKSTLEKILKLPEEKIFEKRLNAIQKTEEKFLWEKIISQIC